MKSISFSLACFVLVSAISPSYAQAEDWKPSKICGLLLGENSSLHQWLATNRIPKAIRAQKTIDSWPKLTPVEYREYFNQNPDESIFVNFGAKDRPRGVIGHAQLVEMGENHTLLAVTDRQGRIHVIDFSSPDISIHPLGQFKQKEISLVKEVIEISFPYVNFTRLKNWAKSKEFEKHPDKEKIAALLQSAVDAQKDNIVLKTYEKTTMVGAASVIPLMIFWFYSAKARFAGYGTDSFLLQHASNFYFGLAAMSLFHGFSTTLRPKHRFTFLTVAALGNIIMNIIEEFDFGSGRLSPNALPPTGNDWVDFSAGVLSVGVYLAVVAYNEGRIHRQVNERESQPTTSDPKIP